MAAEIACTTDGFEALCTAVTAAGLAETLSGGSFTVFAPTDTAFDELLTALDVSLGDIPIKTVTDILLYHAVANKVLDSGDVVDSCGQLLTMANGKPTRTICRAGRIFQKGAGNDDSDLPEIIQTDIKACNGIIHVVDEVILPFYLKQQDPVKAPTEAPKPKPEPSCQSIGTHD